MHFEESGEFDPDWKKVDFNGANSALLKVAGDGFFTMGKTAVQTELDGLKAHVRSNYDVLEVKHKAVQLVATAPMLATHRLLLWQCDAEGA